MHVTADALFPRFPFLYVRALSLRAARDAPVELAIHITRTIGPSCFAAS